MSPMPAPKRCARGKSWTPRTILKGLQRRVCGLGVLGAVNGFELLGDQLAVFPRTEI